MDHVAIMNPKWELIPKILTGKKTIESRWYVNRIAPWDRIHIGDMVYFKNSGSNVIARAKVRSVKQFADLTPVLAEEIYQSYGQQIGVTVDKFSAAIEDKANKHYCILVFLKKPEAVRPFRIDKTGFGSASAWLTVDDIRSIRID